jgi:uncharacterized sulfatase
LQERLQSWPDLSFFPESHLVDEAMEDPVAFGRKHQARMAELMTLADAQLAPLRDAIVQTVAAVGSEDPWKRYWAYLVATSHDVTSKQLGDFARRAAVEDPEVEVRARAAEFLGLTGLGDPRPGIMAALKDSTSAVATNAILNTAVLLKDSEPGFEFAIPEAQVRQTDRYIGDRLAYLAGRPSPRAPKARGTKRP